MTSADLEAFVNTGDHTVVVDPIRRDAWIYDGSEKHRHSQKRGMGADVVAMQRSMNWDAADQRPITMYLPTTRELDVKTKFASRVSTKHDVPTDGELPVISHMLYSGELQNKSAGDIEHEMRMANRLAGNRIFDTSGKAR